MVVTSGLEQGQASTLPENSGYEIHNVYIRFEDKRHTADHQGI